ncbi:MAG: site-specific integrase, partial [Polyangiaceae bacterium]|nr:site-specific integrase [Polyangiaceae bacterium]
MAVNTVSAYATDLSCWSRFCEDAAQGNLQELREQDLRAYLRHLGKSDLSSRTIARRLASLRGLFQFLVDEGILNQNHAKRLKAPHISTKLPEVAESHQLTQLLATPDTSRLIGLRDRAMLSLCYASGLRASELVALEVNDIDWQKGTVSPWGKGKKRRLVPVGSISLEHLEAYLTARRQSPKACQSKSTCLFCGPRGLALSRVSFWKIVKRHCLKAELPLNLKP